MPAGDVALVVVPAEEGQSPGARFAVVDERGTLFGGALPFRPNHVRLGRRADGGVVTAFADLRLNSKVSKPRDAREPLRVYLDSGLVYQSEKAWDFDIADDGSSFFAVEPLAGEVSRLVIHNLDLGTETHHDLGAAWNPFTEAEGPYGASYSRDGREVTFWPPQERDGVLGDYWFYPVDGGPPRVVRALSDRKGMPRRPNTAANGYGDEEGPQRAEVWRRIVPMGIVSLAQAPNGPWLALGDGGTRVLTINTSTGDFALVFPTLEDARLHVPEHLWRGKVAGTGGMNFLQWAWASAALERLRGVLGPEATVEDVGILGGFWFEDGNRLVLSRSIGSHPDMRTVHDVFDMDTVEVDGGPAFRLEKDHMPCGLGGLRGLDVRGGRLVYPGPSAAPTGDRAWIGANPVDDEQIP